MSRLDGQAPAEPTCHTNLYQNKMLVFGENGERKSPEKNPSEHSPKDNEASNVASQ